MEKNKPRDPRGSLEVFSPSSTISRPDNPIFRPRPTWKPWKAKPDPDPEPILSSPSGRADADGIVTSWMALKEPATATTSASPPQRHQPAKTIGEIFSEHEAQKSPEKGEVGAAAQRAAEWGLVLRTDEDTGKLQGVKVRTSRDDQSKPGRGKRDSGSSVRSSGEFSDEGPGKEIGFPRVSEDLKDALSTFQQTFVVSDATKPDYPIMYASAGFFKMTGYTAKEVIGRNCRFLQGQNTDADDVAKIRVALETGSTYCGRLLNYKKDGTPFWNLLTISPIKDETGKVLKYIGMLVEVSKHTEGTKEKITRPNGLPESLIRYDARQKEVASNSVRELVEAVKKPRARSLSESTNRPFIRKSRENEIFDSQTSPNNTAHRRHSHAGTSMEKISELPENPPKKSTRRRSFMS